MKDKDITIRVTSKDKAALTRMFPGKRVSFVMRALIHLVLSGKVKREDLVCIETP